jgi:hypothetical protein
MRRDAAAAAKINSTANDDADGAGARKAKTTLHLSGKLRPSPSMADLPHVITQTDDIRKTDENKKRDRQPKVEKDAPTRSARLDIDSSPQQQQARADLLGPSFSGIVGFDGFSDTPFGGSFDTFPTFTASAQPPPPPPPTDVKTKPKKRIPAALLRPHTYTDKYVPPTTLYAADPLKNIEKVPGPRYVAKPYSPPELQVTENNYEDDYSYSPPSYGYASPEPDYKPKPPPYKYHVPNYRPPIEPKPVEPLKPVIIQVAGQSTAVAAGPHHVPYSSPSPSYRPAEQSYNSGPVHGVEVESYRPTAPTEPYPKLSSYLTPDLYDKEPDNYLDQNQYYNADRLDDSKDDDQPLSFLADIGPSSFDFPGGNSFSFRNSRQKQTLDAGKKVAADKFSTTPIGKVEMGNFFAIPNHSDGFNSDGFDGFPHPDFPTDFGLATSESTIQERTQFFQSSKSAAFTERSQVFHVDRSAERRGGAR